MSADRAKVGSLLESVHKGAKALPAHPGRDPFVQMLAECIALAGGENASIPAIKTSIAAIAARALVLSTEGYMGVDLLLEIGVAFNACLERPPRERLVSEMPTPKLGHLEESVVVATRDRPLGRPLQSEPSSSALPPRAPASASEEPALLLEPVDPDDEEDSDDFPPPTRLVFEEPDPVEMPLPLRHPVVILEAAPPISPSEFHFIVIGEALEMTAALARDRKEVSFSERTSLERRLLAQIDAITVAGTGQIQTALAWWAGALESPLPWSSWAATFFLGCCQGGDATAALADGLEALPVDAVAHGIAAADALSVVPSQEAGELPRRLLLSHHPIARAVGVDVLGRRRAFTIEELRPYLLDANLPVIGAAARAATFLSAVDAQPLIPMLRRWMHLPHASVAWPVSRALLRWGLADPLDDVRARGRLIEILGVAAGEVLVLSGRADDLSLLQTILSRAPISRTHLSLVARFGHPGAWAYLIHSLEDEERANDAANALTTLFGALVAPNQQLNAAAWKRAIADARLSPTTRYRNGQPWHPKVVAAEITSGMLSRTAMEDRLDELVVRAQIATEVDLARFLPDVEPALMAIAGAASGHRGSPTGTW